MHALMKELPLVLDLPQGKVWQVEWGDLIVEYGTFSETVDAPQLLKGLPDDRCQCPHWGYVFKGRLRYRFKDREEVYNAGEVYYAPPGHIPVLEAGLEYLEFSPANELAKTLEVIERNLKENAT